MHDDADLLYAAHTLVIQFKIIPHVLGFIHDDEELEEFAMDEDDLLEDLIFDTPLFNVTDVCICPSTR